MARIGGIGPDEVIIIGDTPYDAEAAAKAGLRTIGVLCGGFSRDSLQKAGCIAIYEGPTDLLAQYDRSPFASNPARS
jgi:phosphoglycolate phosphatase-like HAD superfamily hydrolase